MDMYEERPPEIFTGGYFDQARSGQKWRDPLGNPAKTWKTNRINWRNNDIKIDN